MDLGKEKEPGTRHASRLSLVAETVGFEPTCLSLDKTISSPVPKRTFQKKAGQSGSVCP